MGVNNSVSSHLKYTIYKRLMFTDIAFVCEKQRLILSVKVYIARINLAFELIRLVFCFVIL